MDTPLLERSSSHQTVAMSRSDLGIVGGSLIRESVILTRFTGSPSGPPLRGFVLGSDVYAVL